MAPWTPREDHIKANTDLLIQEVLAITSPKSATCAVVPEYVSRIVSRTNRELIAVVAKHHLARYGDLA